MYGSGQLYTRAQAHECTHTLRTGTVPTQCTHTYTVYAHLQAHKCTHTLRTGSVPTQCTHIYTVYAHLHSVRTPTSTQAYAHLAYWQRPHKGQDDLPASLTSSTCRPHPPLTPTTIPRPLLFPPMIAPPTPDPRLEAFTGNGCTPHPVIGTLSSLAPQLSSTHWSLVCFCCCSCC